MEPIKRTAVLALAAAVVVTLAACSTGNAQPTDPAAQPIAATGAPTAPAAPAAPTAPERPALSAEDEAAVAEYAARFDFGTDGDVATSWLDYQGVEDEFQAAAAAFPLALPDGYTWPASTWLRDEGAANELGAGVVQAWFFWQMATANAAFADHMRGDDDAASAHLDALTAAYQSAVREMYVIDDSLGYLTDVVDRARQGNWTPLYEADVQDFLEAPAYAAVAEQAGDIVDLGTDGFATDTE